MNPEILPVSHKSAIQMFDASDGCKIKRLSVTVSLCFRI